MGQDVAELIAEAKRLRVQFGKHITMAAEFAATLTVEERRQAWQILYDKAGGNAILIPADGRSQNLLVMNLFPVPTGKETE